jgi:hypothetical protein
MIGNQPSGAKEPDPRAIDIDLIRSREAGEHNKTGWEPSVEGEKKHPSHD